MSQSSVVEKPNTNAPPRRRRSTAASPAAHGEPMIWLTGGGLAIAIAMIVGLLGLIIKEGAGTFWPAPLVHLELVDGTTVMGEVTREETFKPSPDELAGLPDAIRSLAIAEVEKNDGVVGRRLVRTGNFELTNEHFRWVPDYLVKKETHPEWGMVVERMEWGRFYGTPVAFVVDGVETTKGTSEVFAKFREAHGPARRRFAERYELQEKEIGEVAHRLENTRLELRAIELEKGLQSAEYAAFKKEVDAAEVATEEEMTKINEKIDALNKENDRRKIAFETAQGVRTELLVADIVRMYAPNRLDTGDKWGVYLGRWGEFLTDDPREMNTEGGVFPAIFGTVLMTLIMTLLVVPFGVLAALYLREYAKAGTVITIVRIAVNNLAGVPSIVFGVFGLGFFCYITGATIDNLLFEEKLPNPTFGTGGMLWASFTLALLTLPVVIVAVEEALAAVPNSMREGSYACGASKWQTIRRIVLPRAMPGIMTGMILAMARGAGEVAPLMLVGAVKKAGVPVDGVFPYIHFEQSFMHLGYYIFDLGFQSPNSEAAKPMVFTTTLLLIGIVAILNLTAVFLRSRLRRRFVAAQF